MTSPVIQPVLKRMAWAHNMPHDRKLLFSEAIFTGSGEQRQRKLKFKEIKNVPYIYLSCHLFNQQISATQKRIIEQYECVIIIVPIASNNILAISHHNHNHL